MSQVIVKTHIDVAGIGRKELAKALDSVIYDFSRAMIRGIRKEFYEGRMGSQGVDKHTGKAWEGWDYKFRKRAVGDQQKGTILFFNKSSHGDFLEEKTITPRKGDYIAVPIKGGGATIGSGWKKRFLSPAHAKTAIQTKVVIRGNKFFIVDKAAYAEDEENRKAWLYVLKKQVNTPAYTENLPDFVDAKARELIPALTQKLLVFKGHK